MNPVNNDSNKVTVEIWSDVMCPFCYIGKRRFEKALDQFTFKQDVEVVWKSFQLNPSMVTNPDVSVKKHLAEQKGWSAAQTDQAMDHVIQMAAEEGLHYDFDKAVVANSFKAHRLLQYAKTKNQGDALKEALLKAYFIDGKNTDDDAILLDLAIAVGLDKAESIAVLQNKDSFAEAVKTDIQEANQMGIRGVPYFVINSKYGISGAQEVKVFEQALRQAYAETQLIESAAGSAEGAVCTPEGECE